MKNLSFASLIAFLFISTGCTTTTPIQKTNGQLNLNYQAQSKQTMTDKTIAIVSFIKKQEKKNTTNTSSPFQELIQTQLNKKLPFSFNYSFAQKYQKQLSDKMAVGLLELYSSKGFKTAGPFETFDDITYVDKKTFYLASTNSLQIDFQTNMSKKECKTTWCTEEGTISISGDLTYKLIEPLTGQTFLTKRISLSDFNIEKPYIKQTNISKNSISLTEMAFNAAASKISKPAQLQDNTDKALTDAINEFYSLAMEKIDTHLSREEILSFESDIQGLKQQKRY